MKYRGLRYDDLDIETKRLIVAARDAQIKSDALCSAAAVLHRQAREAEEAAAFASDALNKEWDRRNAGNRFILGDYTLGLDPTYYGDDAE